MRAAILTVSTSKAAGEGVDESGPLLAEVAREMGADVVAVDVITDDREAIAKRLRHWADDESVELVLTTGGTGFAPSDVTPEATHDVLDREAPGIGEAMRAISREHTDLWMVSRAIAGTRGNTLIVNFPGSPKAIRQIGDALAPALLHAVKLLGGAKPH